MSTTSEKARRLLEKLSSLQTFDQVLKQVSIPSSDTPVVKELPGPLSWSKEAQQKRLSWLEKELGQSFPRLSGSADQEQEPESLRGNIENYIGMTQVPTGIVGPVHIHGTLAQGDYYVPMATTEGALVASYNRGAKAARLSGGITSVCLTESVQRAPVFRFQSLPEVGAFAQWVLMHIDTFKIIVSQKSRYAKLEDLRINMEGNQVTLVFEYTTGDAAGQNMVTICTDAVCQYILSTFSIKPSHWFIESNYSGDKKATSVAFATVRGKKVTAEAMIKKELVHRVLNSSPAAIAQYWQTSSVGAVQSGAIGIQGHYANGLAAIFLACGQDVACVTEAYVGITRMEVSKEGDLYVAVTLPGLIVGTVGGGTRLGTQQECLKLIGCTGEGTARKFAEICGATILAGELSIAAAIASGDFSRAHKLFGRK
ncbi:MAG: hydroxymethylglutaryl-CoA reductase [Cytophagaceae bacterium]|nr:hydroxymethylglutaryl-CoA reductase [Cytophagaceae bacterium]